MGLKIAQKLREAAFNGFPTHFDTVPTDSQASKSVVSTTPHILQYEQAANDDSNGLVTSAGMPVHFFDDDYHGWRFGDREWIKGKLRRVRNQTERVKLAVEYAEQYKAAHDAESLEHKKDGKARFTANSWLLKATK